MEKIEKLKKIFIKERIDGYIIPKNDEFFSEYIPDHNDRLNFITDFSGSYGFALILKNQNYLGSVRIRFRICLRPLDQDPYSNLWESYPVTIQLKDANTRNIFFLLCKKMA